MIKFNDIKYERVEYEVTKEEIDNLVNELVNCNNSNKYIEIIKKIINIQNHIEEMYDYIDINNMRNLDDEFYKNEIEYWNIYKNKFDSLFLSFYNEISNSKYKEIIKEYLPNNFFRIINCQSKVTSNEVSNYIKVENELKAKYKNLNKSKIIFDNKEETISSISGLYSNSDRNIRKKAHDSVNDFYYNNQKEYDEILYNLINIRNEYARKLGFNSYVDYSLYKLKRFGYDYKDISKFRNNIIKYIIPICKLMSEWQKQELNVDELKYYDTVYFTEMPKIKEIDLLNELKKSFNKANKELGNLFNNMLDNGYIDLEKRNNKVNFSITNYLTETCIPTITGNYKNNYLDVSTTTHEMGHAFQKYYSSIKDKEYIVSSLLKYPNFEIAEMFSHSMELIMLDHLDNIFNKEDYKKYCFMKIYNLISNLPYICLVDEYQEVIYSKNNLKIEDIRNTWILLAKKYQLEKSNSGHINLDTGGALYKYSHIYLDPFYYIDYALSYFGAFTIYDNNDLFKEIGSVASYYSYKELIEKYSLPNPFDEDVVKNISYKLKEELKRRRLDV